MENSEQTDIEICSEQWRKECMRNTKKTLVGILEASVKDCWELREENARMKAALETVANWKLPETGKFWDDEKTKPMSYEAAYGSNGSRDYMKKIAQIALTPAAGKNK